MKIYFKRFFKYMSVDGRDVHKILPGTYEVPRQVGERPARLALVLGQAVIVPEPKVEVVVPEPEAVVPEPKKTKKRKKAPENKLLKAKESK